MITGYKNLRVGLLGETLSHSTSPIVHGVMADYPYRFFEVKKENLDAFMRSDLFDCINVTIPHKLAVMPYLDALTDTARAVGAVNSIKRQGGKLIGHNTDVFGFRYLLQSAGFEAKGKKALVLGSGGASRAVRYALTEAGASEIVTVSRTGNVNYGNIENHADADLLVNATPVGMYPHMEDELLLSLSAFSKLQLVVDLIYRPLKTKLLLEAEKCGIHAVNGLTMVAAQAKEAAEFFTGETPDADAVNVAVAECKKQIQNIILIGMPGCGKTTVGQALSRLTGLPFFDSDEEIAKTFGASAEDIISEEGEGAFREKESIVLYRLAHKMGAIIALGDGAVLNTEAMGAMSANGIFVLLDRPLSELSTVGRPLSSEKGVAALCKERAPVYQKYADVTVAVRGADITAKDIIKELSL